MRRHAEILFAYFAQFLKTRLAYRADFVVDSLAVVVALGIQLAFLGVLYTKIRSLSGWSFEQLLFIHGFSLVPLGLFNLISPNLWAFSERHLVEGRFDRVLLRPIDPLFQVLFESFNVAALNEIVLGFVLMGFAGAELGVAWGLRHLLLLPVLAVSAAAVYLGVFVILTAISFWFEDRLGIGPPVYNLIRFARYPVTIYHTAIRALLSWVIPFGFAAFYPSTALLGLPEFRTFAMLTPVMGALCLGLAIVIFRVGTRQYTSTGS